MGLQNISESSWKNPLALFQLAIAVIHLPLFVYVESRAKEPFAPLHLIFGLDLIGQYLCIFFGVAASFGIMFYLPLLFKVVYHATSAQAGLALVPAVVTAVFGSLVWAVLMKRTGRFFWLIVGAYACLTLGCLLLLFFSGVLVDSTAGLVIGLAVGGIGNGAGITSTLIAIIANSTPEDQATVTACSYLSRSLGSAVGLSFSSMAMYEIMEAQLNQRLAGIPDIDVGAIIRQVGESLDYVDELAPDLKDLVLGGYAIAIRAAFGILVGYALLALMSAGLVREKRLRS
jgi:predicted MFS family arabinose efflux permease